MSEHALPSILINDFSENDILRLPPDFYKKASSYLNKSDIKKIQKAYTLAFYAHEGQLRRDGSKYITHPVAVSNILLDLKMDPDSICAALMHDVLEDCDVNKNNSTENIQTFNFKKLLLVSEQYQSDNNSNVQINFVLKGTILR